jgi:hypothetical protein
MHFVNDPGGIAALIMTQVFLFLGQFGVGALPRARYLAESN